MASIRQSESIGSLTRTSTTTASLAASRINIGGQQYVITTALTLNTATVGVGGVDATLIANKVYYVYAVLSSGSLGLIASQASTLPSGFTQARVVGYFYSNASSQIQWANKTPAVIQTILTSGSGSFVPQSTTNAMKVTMSGGGGGGSGGGTVNTLGSGSSGTASTFGTLLVANAGQGSGNYNSVPGGTATIAAPAFGLAIQGGSGTVGGFITTSGAAYPTTGTGGTNSLGGASLSFVNGPGQAPTANTGAGGAGGGSSTQTNSNGGGGGSAGGYLIATINNPSSFSSFAWSVGTGGAGGAAGTAGMVAGPGSAGIIIIEEYAQ